MLVLDTIQGQTEESRFFNGIPSGTGLRYIVRTRPAGASSGGSSVPLARRFRWRTDFAGAPISLARRRQGETCNGAGASGAGAPGRMAIPGTDTRNAATTPFEVLTQYSAGSWNPLELGPPR